MRTLRLLLLPLLLTASAQAKSLAWRALDVRAQLDAEGRLHVVERHDIVFDGDWNGGERVFRVGPGQSLAINGVSREENGRDIPLVKGSLESVDDYKLDGKTLRWRSRRPSDPPFSNTAITYAIDYTVAGVVRRDGAVYRLDHDFTFDHPGAIGRFSLELTFDGAWGAEPVSIVRSDLPPGEHVVVTRELQWRGSGAPASAAVALPPAMTWPVAGVLLLVVAFLAGSFFANERRTGRLAPLQPPETIDDGWLERHLFTLPPEVAGGTWDGSVGSPEVAAVLARMTAEKKIASSVDPAGLLRRPVLRLRLLVDRSQLQGYEGELVDKLFFDGRNETDTESVQQRYRTTGLDLAALIKPGVNEALQKLPGWKDKAYRPPWVVDSVLVLAGMALLLWFGFGGSERDGVAAAVMAVASAGSLLAASIAAGVNRRAIASVRGRAIGVLLLLLPMFAVFVVWTALAGAQFLRLVTLVFGALLAAAVTNLVLDIFRIPDTPETIAFRKSIAAARAYFIAQLHSARPRLRDEWLPWLLAFGLGDNVDRWFHSFGSGGPRTHDASTVTRSSSPSTASSGWSGGGGMFGGAGATGAWTAAAGALAAGVSAPSSSSGGGGGSSSGGGSAGGW